MEKSCFCHSHSFDFNRFFFQPALIGPNDQSPYSRYPLSFILTSPVQMKPRHLSVSGRLNMKIVIRPRLHPVITFGPCSVSGIITNVLCASQKFRVNQHIPAPFAVMTTIKLGWIQLGRRVYHYFAYCMSLLLSMLITRCHALLVVKNRQLSSRVVRSQLPHTHPSPPCMSGRS